MQKVIYVIDSLQTGGAEKSLLDISSRLKKFKPVVVHIYKNDFLKSEFQTRGIKVVSLDVSGPYNFIKAFKKLKDVLLAEKPTIVVATLLRSELLSRMVCKSLDILNIGTFVSDTYSKQSLDLLTFQMKLKIRFFWLFNMVTARYCAAFLSNSESIKISNCKALLIPKRKVKVVYRGRRKDIFRFAEKTFTAKSMKFLSIGRLLPLKGFQELVLSFSKYISDYPEATLTIAGEGPYRKSLERLITNYALQNAVCLAGNIKDVNSLMHEHDVFVFPSHYEGFSGTVVEAMFSGIPILASDIPMNKEAIEHMKTGYLFPAKDEDLLRQAMVWATQHTDNLRIFSLEARKVAEQRFDIDLISSQHEEFYEDILAGSKK